MTKYTPLQTYLSGLPSGTKDVTLPLNGLNALSVTDYQNLPNNIVHGGRMRKKARTSRREVG
jgi:hypothetical protein